MRLQRRVTTLVLLAGAAFVALAAVQGAIQTQEVVSIYFGLYSMAFLLEALLANLLLFSMRGATQRTANTSGVSHPNTHHHPDERVTTGLRIESKSEPQLVLAGEASVVAPPAVADLSSVDLASPGQTDAIIDSYLLT